MSAIEAVLQAAQNLSEIFVSSSHNTLPSQACITMHGASLQMLLVNIGERQYYSRTAAVAILQACPALRQLAIRFPCLYLGNGDDWKRQWALKENFGNTRRIRSILPGRHQIRRLPQGFYVNRY
jgi:hypothetical protein